MMEKSVIIPNWKPIESDGIESMVKPNDQISTHKGVSA